MNLIEKIKVLFRKKEIIPSPAPETQKTTTRLKRTCKGCGKNFSYDPTWDHIPNYCKDCKKKYTAEREEKQRAGAPRKIKRKCKACGRYFTFPNTLEHYPNYCSNCRKKHQAEMKAKYSRGKKG